MNLPLKGIIPPVVTPLTDNTTLDVRGIENLVEHLVSGGVHGLFILGTTGEAPSLSHKLRKDFIKRTCELVNHRIPVMVGITDTSFEESLEIAEYSKIVGADAVVVAPPYYIPISQSEMVYYLGNLIPRSPLPLLLYNMPSHTKLHMVLSTVKAAKDLGAIGIKDSSGDMFYQTSLIEEFKGSPEFSIITGTELFIPETIMMGGHGAIAGGANMFPKLFVELYEASLARDFERISAMREVVMGLYNTIYNVSNNSSKYIKGIKCVLKTMGICNDYAALPLSRYEGADREKIEGYVAAMKK
ncbi:MAG: dihydrodipicolinate synthase family protein [Bacteroidia bacterium]|nr:dihydrodipicolinate synthase family protein [Bacteroidia bacterium]